MLKTISAQGQPNGITSLIFIDFIARRARTFETGFVFG
jgi:hypothetical protein